MNRWGKCAWWNGAALQDRFVIMLQIPKTELTGLKLAMPMLRGIFLTPKRKLELLYYHSFHEVTLKGQVSKMDFVYRYLLIGTEKVFFDDIYEISIVD